MKDIGSLVYERDGTQYTYQGGAVWQGTGNGTQLLSAPQASYQFGDRDGRARPTLNFDIPDLQGSKSLGSDTVVVEHSRTVAALTDVSAVDDELITMSITSDFYVGWGPILRAASPRDDDRLLRPPERHGDDRVRET